MDGVMGGWWASVGVEVELVDVRGRGGGHCWFCALSQ